MNTKPQPKRSRSGAHSPENCRFSVVLPKELRERIDLLAEKDRRKTTEWIRMQLEDLVKNYPIAKRP